MNENDIREFAESMQEFREVRRYNVGIVGTKTRAQKLEILKNRKKLQDT